MAGPEDLDARLPGGEGLAAVRGGDPEMLDLTGDGAATVDEAALDRAAAVLRAGGAVVLPTDTVYGLAALPSVPGATAALTALKDRSAAQPLAVLVADAEQARALVALDGMGAGPGAAPVDRWMAELWPGPLTLVLPRSAAARGLALGGDPRTIGVRCPDHAFVRALARRVGPIATTSANRHGEATPTTARAAAAALTGPVHLVIDGGPAGTVASTVVEVVVEVVADPGGEPSTGPTASAGPGRTEAWRVLRPGAVPADRLRDR